MQLNWLISFRNQTYDHIADIWPTSSTRRRLSSRRPHGPHRNLGMEVRSYRDPESYSWTYDCHWDVVAVTHRQRRRAIKIWDRLAPSADLPVTFTAVRIRVHSLGKWPYRSVRFKICDGTAEKGRTYGISCLKHERYEINNKISELYPTRC